MFENVANFILCQARHRPKNLFAKLGSQELSFSEAVQYIQRIAAGLERDGLDTGDRIAVLGKNSIEILCIILAAASRGVVCVPINYRLTTSEVGYILDDAECRLIFFDEEFSTALPDTLVHSPKRVCLNKNSEFAQWLETAEPAALRPLELGENTFVQLYTSGTTGKPKGVLLSHRSFIYNCIQVNVSTGCTTQATTRQLMIAPNFHAVGLSASLWTLMFGGGLIVHRDFDPAAVVRSIVCDKVTAIAAVPVMLQFILSLPNIEECDFSSLNLIMYGGSPMSPSLLERCVEVFKCNLAQGYGQTEATGLTILSPEAHSEAASGRPELLQSAGRPVLETEIRIDASNLTESTSSRAGEITAAGGQIMKGYWNLDNATNDAMGDGWLRTGDIGEIDKEGYLYVKDRLKDMIISGGENVYPAEIEAILVTHPKVIDCAVVGKPDERWGEVPVAFLVAESPVDEGDILQFARARLAGFKVPKSISYLEQLPRNPSGKLLKRELRKLL